MSSSERFCLLRDLLALFLYSSRLSFQTVAVHRRFLILKISLHAYVLLLILAIDYYLIYGYRLKKKNLLIGDGMHLIFPWLRLLCVSSSVNKINVSSHCHTVEIFENVMLNTLQELINW